MSDIEISQHVEHLFLLIEKTFQHIPALNSLKISKKLQNAYCEGVPIEELKENSHNLTKFSSLLDQNYQSFLP